MTKSDIRKQIRRLKAERLSAASAIQVCEAVARHPKVAAARNILLYHSLPDEADTTALLSALGGRNVILPVVVGDMLELRLYTGQTQCGAFGIEEPIGPLYTRFDDIDVAIVPGMAFTHDGKRLGRGKGYYDRLLPLLKNAFKIGLCHEWQIVDYIPTEPHDIVMDEIISV